MTLPAYLPMCPDLLCVGINPSTCSAQQGHYYLRATNRFCWALRASGLTPVKLSLQEDFSVVEFGPGPIDPVQRPTDSAADMRGEERTQPARHTRRPEGAQVFVLPSASVRNAAYPRSVILAYFQGLKTVRDELKLGGGHRAVQWL